MGKAEMILSTEIEQIYQKHTNSLNWEMLVQSMIDIGILYVLLMLTEPYFEFYDMYWYIFLLMVIPLSACSVAASGLSRLRKLVVNDFLYQQHQLIQEEQRVLQGMDDHRKHFSLVSGWQGIGIISLSVIFLFSILQVWVYAHSAKNLFSALSLVFVTICSVYMSAAFILRNKGRRLIQQCYLSLQTPGKNNEDRSFMFVFKYYLIPYQLLGCAIITFLSHKFYMGMSDELGHVDAYTIARNASMTASVMAGWIGYEVYKYLGDDKRLGNVHFTEIGSWREADVLGLAFFMVSLPGILISALSNWFGWEQFPYIAGVWIELGVTCYAVFIGIAAAVIFHFRDQASVLSAKQSGSKNQDDFDFE